MNNTQTFNNPIIPGFYPDPTICRVGNDYYLATSSFELFPALPVFHSTDLVHWKQICYAMDRTEQLYMSANLFSGGMMAPTLRYHDGIFYMMCCNFADSGNFLITAKDPAGPWSDPVMLPDIPGIDASFFFDDDGKCYVHGTGDFDFPDGDSRGVWGAEFDIQTGKLLGEPRPLWQSALRGAHAPEAPHIYHIGDWYYLLTAEGGTEHYHSAVIGRCKTPLGTYECNPSNPLITHRHLGKLYPIGNPGHADLVETQNGEWYAVLLASRLVDGYHKNMGRETYMVPVAWEDEWPIFSPGTGKVEFQYPLPDLPKCEGEEPLPVRDDFDGESLRKCWVFWGTPYQDFWRLEDGALKLKALPRKLAAPLQKIVTEGLPEKVYDDNVACVIRRQCQPNFEAECSVVFSAKENECAGFVMMQQCNHQLRIEKREDKIVVMLAECTINCPPFMPQFKDATVESVLCEKPYTQEQAVFGVRVKGQDIEVLLNGELLCRADGKKINAEDVGPMVGTMVGMFATSNGGLSDAWASFDWFDYREEA